MQSVNSLQLHRQEETEETGMQERATSMHAVAYMAFALSGTLVGVVIGVIIGIVVH